ncbi:hypothetical protein PMAYCL1PPCAC_08011, partial [Pristionchus mayeri]
ENGLLPFIELDGVQTCESQVILKRLTHHFNLKKYADSETEGIAHAIERQPDNYTAHLLRYDSINTLPSMIKVFLDGRVPSLFMPSVAAIASFFMRRSTRSAVQTSIGKRTKEEYDEMLRDDLLQLQNVLGDKQFLMGDTPTEVDCLALAHIGSAY